MTYSSRTTITYRRRSLTDRIWESRWTPIIVTAIICLAWRMLAD